MRSRGGDFTTTSSRINQQAFGKESEYPFLWHAPQESTKDPLYKKSKENAPN